MLGDSEYLGRQQKIIRAEAEVSGAKMIISWGQEEGDTGKTVLEIEEEREENQ
jgi:hypothetical protein